MKAIYKLMLASTAMVVLGAMGMKAQTGTPDPVKTNQGSDQDRKISRDSVNRNMQNRSTRDSVNSKNDKMNRNSRPDTDHKRGDKMHQDGQNKTSPPDSLKN